MDFLNSKFLASYGIASQLPASNSDIKEIVFCGRSNVGKSSLINLLCNRKSLAKVSSEPGKTTTINYFSLGESNVLVDLPGYGYARRSHAEKLRWAKLLEHYFSSGRNIGLVLQLLDSRHNPSNEDIEMLNYLRMCRMPVIVVLTKTDKLNKTEYAEQTDYFETLLQQYEQVISIVPFSIRDITRAAALRETIESNLA